MPVGYVFKEERLLAELDPDVEPVHPPIFEWLGAPLLLPTARPATCKISVIPAVIYAQLLACSDISLRHKSNLINLCKNSTVEVARTPGSHFSGCLPLQS